MSPHSVSFFLCPDRYLPLPSSACGWPSLDHFLYGSSSTRKCSARDQQRSLILACQRPRDHFPRICVGAHNCASKPEGVRIYQRHRCVCHCWPCSPPSPILFNEPSKACALIRPQPSSRRQAVRRRQHCRLRTPSLCHRTALSYCPASATRPLASLSPSPPLLWPPPSGRHAATDAAHRTVPLRCRRFWGDGTPSGALRKGLGDDPYCIRDVIFM